MVKWDIHVLDSNVMLAMVLPNDRSYNLSKSYLSLGYIRYVSENACVESKNVIVTLRRISLKIINFIINYFSRTTINFKNINMHFVSIKNKFLNQYGDNEFPEGIKKDKFINVVTNFLIEHEYEINNILINSDLKEANAFKKDIIASFNKLYDDLDSLLMDFYCISFIESGDYVEKLSDIGIHEKDAILLDESYYLFKFLKKHVFFVTFDGGILELSKEVEKLFSSNIRILSPVYFMT